MNIYDIEANPALSKLRALARPIIGHLIGVPEVPPLVIELRRSPYGQGWWMRADFTAGVWAAFAQDPNADVGVTRLALMESYQGYLIDWPEQGERNRWEDA